MAKTKNTDTKPVQQFHYFGSTGINWACADSREEVLAKLARAAGANIIRINVKEQGGMYAWTTRVELPEAVSYRIENFTPVNVPCSSPRQHRILSLTMSTEMVPESVPLDECQLHDPYGKGTRPAVEAASE